jgi:hypothetical protein
VDIPPDFQELGVLQDWIILEPILVFIDTSRRGVVGFPDGNLLENAFVVTVHGIVQPDVVGRIDCPGIDASVLPLEVLRGTAEECRHFDSLVFP